MTPQLRKKIDELIELDNKRHIEQEEKYPNRLGITSGSPESDEIVHNILYGEKDATLVAIEALSSDEISYVTALMWFGRGDGIAEPGAMFESVLIYAKQKLDSGSNCYLNEKPLRTYLPRGLKRLGII